MADEQRDPELDFLTLDEVAAAFRVHERTVIRLVQAGRLRGLKIGGAWRFYRNDIATFLKGSTVVAGRGNRPAAG